MQTEDKHPLFIPKDLEAEANIKDHVAYFPMAGQSQIDNFRSPDSYVLLFLKKAKDGTLLILSGMSKRITRSIYLFPVRSIPGIVLHAPEDTN